MITNWKYTNIGGERDNIKKIIRDNNFVSIDVGGYADFWSYPECKTVIDINKPENKDILFYKVNLENRNEMNEFTSSSVKIPLLSGIYKDYK